MNRSVACFWLALVAGIASDQVALAQCPNESTLLRDQYVFATMHGSLDSHTIERYFNYPWFSSTCDESYGTTADNYDELIAVGSVMERRNCAEIVDEAIVEKTTSISYTLSLGGTYGKETGAELGWELEGVGNLGLNGTTSWTLSAGYSTTVSGTYKISTGPIPPNTLEWWQPYITKKYRKGIRYYYNTDTVYVWCDTHSLWGNSVGGQTDIYSHYISSVVTKAGDGLYHDSCSCTCNPNTGVSTAWTTMTVPATPGATLKTYTAGKNFYNY